MKIDMLCIENEVKKNIEEKIEDNLEKIESEMAAEMKPEDLDKEDLKNILIQRLKSISNLHHEELLQIVDYSINPTTKTPNRVLGRQLARELRIKSQPRSEKKDN